MPPLSLSLSKSLNQRLDQMGNTWDFGGGDWTVNLAGSGFSNQSAASGNIILWLGLGAMAAYLILQK